VLGLKSPGGKLENMVYRSIKPILVDAVQVKEASDVATPGGVLHLNAGDWLVRDSQGNVARCNDVDFKCTYEALHSSISLADLQEGKPCGC
jgi:hypothetical protein